ncbi:hypothetical protein O6H91_06G066200 [Diphasiastrum complanatum]|uniref:Uncharacterized protein n=1 Tax=Diphasiastrum complanatum TaxID=34168 RepID=A0ACC2DEZ9_DIPCM|nr:hypothetical protein O6H91_06G066200 [Diphasiastrum complanatum]
MDNKIWHVENGMKKVVLKHQHGRQIVWSLHEEAHDYKELLKYSCIGTIGIIQQNHRYGQRGFEVLSSMLPNFHEWKGLYASDPDYGKIYEVNFYAPLHNKEQLIGFVSERVFSTICNKSVYLKDYGGCH